MLLVSQYKNRHGSLIQLHTYVLVYTVLINQIQQHIKCACHLALSCF